MATDTCPDYSSAYNVKANSSSCPSQLNSVEQHFVISKRTQGKNRTYTLSALKMSLSTQRKKDLPKPNIIQIFKQGMARLSSEREERAESAAIIAASRVLRASGGELDDEIESDGDRDEHIALDNFLASLDELLIIIIIMSSHLMQSLMTRRIDKR